MNGKRIKNLILAFAAIMVLMSSTNVMAAADTDSMPDLISSTGSLKVVYQYSGESVINIDGAEIDVIQVADVTVSDGSVHYELLPEFESTGITLDGMSTEQSIEAASTLDSLAAKSVHQGSKKVTDSQGSVTFDNVPVGMYLVRQTGASGTAQNYEYFDPFLVMVPEKDPGSASWIYDVTTQPKSETKKVETTTTPPTPPKSNPTPTVTKTPGTPTNTTTGKTESSPKTGDSSHVMFYAGLLLISGGVAAVLLLKRRTAGAKNTSDDN
ncbi:MAG: pilin N-terminal domain-containing protein [Bilifractor sp.]